MRALTPILRHFNFRRAIPTVMPNAPRLPSVLRGALPVYVLATVLCLLITAKVLRLGRVALDAPLSYSGDALLHMGWIKNIVETGWYLHNDRIGAPGGQDLRCFPGADTLHHATIKLLACFTSDVPSLFNLFYLLTFPLTTLTTLFVLRRFGVSNGTAVAVSLLYTFLPYHYGRIGHLFLAAYYTLPLAGLLAVRLYQGRPFMARDGEPRQCLKRDWFAAGLVSVLLGFGGAYYAFFACFFFLIAGLAGALMLRRWAPIRHGGVLIGIVFVCFVIAVLPTIAQRLGEGANPDDPQRTPFESELYGLKLIQMLLPVAEHQFAPLRDLATEYNAYAPLVNENRQTSLGLVAGFGLMFLLGRVLLHYRSAECGSTLDGLALITMAAVVLGTIGGLGTTFAYYVSPWIRAWNRLSICIGFFALTAVAILLETARQRWATTPLRRCIFTGLLAVFLVGGLTDVVPRYRMRWCEQEHAEFKSDREFVHAIEARVPPGRLVCQWPIRPYPEPPREAPGIRFYAYDHLRLHLHSRTLHWTYGGARGLEGDAWCRHLERQPLEQQLLTLCHAEAGGICIDRNAYPDRAAALIEKLSGYLGAPEVTSPDERRVFFELTPWVTQLRGRYEEERWAELRDRALHPVLIFWHNGFFEEEHSTIGPYRWVSSDAKLVVHNGGREPVRVRFGLSFDRPHWGATAPVHIESSLFAQTIQLGDAEARLDRIIDVPPGDHYLRFTCAAAPQPRGEDVKRRRIVYRVYHVECAAAPESREAESWPWTVD